jgi:hypothetical protein
MIAEITCGVKMSKNRHRAWSIGHGVQGFMVQGSKVQDSMSGFRCQVSGVSSSVTTKDKWFEENLRAGYSSP